MISSSSRSRQPIDHSLISSYSLPYESASGASSSDSLRGSDRRSPSAHKRSSRRSLAAFARDKTSSAFANLTTAGNTSNPSLQPPRRASPGNREHLHSVQTPCSHPPTTLCLSQIRNHSMSLVQYEALPHLRRVIQPKFRRISALRHNLIRPQVVIITRCIKLRRVSCA